MKPDLALKLPKSGHYVVAISGGVDSVALLHLLLSQPDHDLQLRVVHVNHGLRPDAAADERFVQQLARTYALPFDSVQLDLGQANEAVARHKRYQFLQAVMTAEGARGIITAHHADDRAETSIINTLRGSGRHGQAASFKRRQVLRPLLSLRKSDLYDYARYHGLAWREDQTNQLRTIDRNFIRHELLSQSDGYSKHHDALLLAHQSLNKQLDGRLSKTYYDFKTPAGLELPRTWLATESWPALAAFIHFGLRKLDPAHEYSRLQIEELVRTAKTATAGSQISLPGALKLQVGYDKVAIVVAADVTIPLPKLQLTTQTSLRYGLFWLSFGTHTRKNASTIRLPVGKYWVRTTKSGDHMMTKVGTKKIQDIFVDKKIARTDRPIWPLVTNRQDDILWVANLALDPRYQDITEGYQLTLEEV